MSCGSEDELHGEGCKKEKGGLSGRHFRGDGVWKAKTILIAGCP